MIRKAYRATVRFLKSAGLVSGLLAFIGVWSMVASFVPQGDASTREVAAWAAAHRGIEPVVRAVGLHQAFTGFVFLACVSVLALSTALCSWQRTRVSIGRARTLRKALGADGRSIAEKHDLEIACAPALSESEVLSIASETLAVRLDAFEPDYRTGGIDRGPVPTVSVLDGAGNVIKTQRVYPNMMLHSGSISISAPPAGYRRPFPSWTRAGSRSDAPSGLSTFLRRRRTGPCPWNRSCCPIVLAISG